VLSIVCINYMSCLSKMTADFRSILSSLTSSASIDHCLGLITKKIIFLVMYRENKSYSKMTKGLVRYQQFQSQVNVVTRALKSVFSYHIMKWKDEQKWTKRYENVKMVFVFLLRIKIKNLIYTINVPILYLTKDRKNK